MDPGIRRSGQGLPKEYVYLTLTLTCTVQTLAPDSSSKFDNMAEELWLHFLDRKCMEQRSTRFVCLFSNHSSTVLEIF